MMRMGADRLIKFLQYIVLIVMPGARAEYPVMNRDHGKADAEDMLLNRPNQNMASDGGSCYYHNGRKDMAWISKLKDIATTNVVGHVNSDPDLIERAPTNLSISFTPLELYGAAARCSYLSFVNPLIATTESDTVAKLVETHVDDVSNDFAILASADNFKDYIKSYFSGTVATGLAYLAMINEGYIWGDHFENAGGGNSTHTRKPDFVFGGLGVGVALMESKGSRSGTLKAFDATVLDGYTDQVEPHLGYVVGGAMATHGYCIGAWLKSPMKAELRVHHTKVPMPGAPAYAIGTPTLATIQRHNFATAFSLAHSPELGADLRRGESRYSEIGFLRTSWSGRNWLAHFGLGIVDWRNDPDWHFFFHHFWGWDRIFPWSGSHFFAIEETIAMAALRRFLGREGAPSEKEEIVPLDEGIRGAAREHRGEGGAVFPDGLAILSPSKLNLRFEPVTWDVTQAMFL